MAFDRGGKNQLILKCYQKCVEQSDLLQITQKKEEVFKQLQINFDILISDLNSKPVDAESEEILRHYDLLMKTNPGREIRGVEKERIIREILSLVRTAFEIMPKKYKQPAETYPLFKQESASRLTIQYGQNSKGGLSLFLRTSHTEIDITTQDSKAHAQLSPQHASPLPIVPKNGY